MHQLQGLNILSGESSQSSLPSPPFPRFCIPNLQINSVNLNSSNNSCLCSCTISSISTYSYCNNHSSHSLNLSCTVSIHLWSQECPLPLFYQSPSHLFS